MSYPSKKCEHCDKDAVAVESGTFFYCAMCWIKRMRKQA